MRKVLSGLIPLAAAVRGRLADLARSARPTGLGPLGRSQAGRPLSQRPAHAETSSPTPSSATTSGPSSTCSCPARSMTAERELAAGSVSTS